jgi:hypothetical protein
MFAKTVINEILNFSGWILCDQLWDITINQFVNSENSCSNSRLYNLLDQAQSFQTPDNNGTWDPLDTNNSLISLMVDRRRRVEQHLNRSAVPGKYNQFRHKISTLHLFFVQSLIKGVVRRIILFENVLAKAERS